MSGAGRPWHREPWPWFIIGLLATAVIASFVTLWIALRHPDTQVVDDAHYDEIRSELRAQPDSDEDVQAESLNDAN